MAGGVICVVFGTIMEAIHQAEALSEPALAPLVPPSTAVAVDARERYGENVLREENLFRVLEMFLKRSAHS